MEAKVTIDLSEYENLKEIKNSVINKDNVVYKVVMSCGTYRTVGIHNANEEYKKMLDNVELLNSINKDIQEDRMKESIKHNKEMIRLIKKHNNTGFLELCNMMSRKVFSWFYL